MQFTPMRRMSPVRRRSMKAHVSRRSAPSEPRLTKMIEPWLLASSNTCPGDGRSHGAWPFHRGTTGKSANACHAATHDQGPPHRKRVEQAADAGACCRRDCRCKNGRQLSMGQERGVDWVGCCRWLQLRSSSRYAGFRFRRGAGGRVRRGGDGSGQKGSGSFTNSRKRTWPFFCAPTSPAAVAGDQPNRPFAIGAPAF